MSCLLSHQSFPLAVAKDSDDNVEGIKRCLEGNIFVKIKRAGDHINGYPNEPLLQIFARQSPDADKAEGGGETVGDGYARVGVGYEQIVNDAPDGKRGERPWKDETALEVRDGNGC